MKKDILQIALLTKKKDILKPNLYTNKLFNLCDIDVIDPTNEEEFKNYIGDNEHFKYVHYIIPNVQTNITSPKQIMNFTEDGHHEIYPSIKFIYLHSLTYVIKSNYCLYGGKIIINIGDKILGSIDDITVSPDQIAVYKIEYEKEKKNIIIYFKRGLNSNEQFGKNVTVTINIEKLKSQEDETFFFTLEELKFDISSPSTDYEKYYNISYGNQIFNYISAFSFPALLIKAELDRPLNGYETLEPFNRYRT